MEPIVNYLEDVETKIMKEMSVLFQKMRDQRDTMSLTGIEDMYRCEPIKGVLYEPCVRIPGPGGHYYCSEYALPKEEYVICSIQSIRQHTSGQTYAGATNKCIAITNYGRCFLPKQIGGEYGRGYNSYTPTNDTTIQLEYRTIPIQTLDPLPYKMPEHFIKVFHLGLSIGRIREDSLHMNINGDVHEQVITTLSNTCSSLQELNKEFYLFAGKWKPHMTETATLDVDNMRQTILEHTASIQDLSGKNQALESRSIQLQAEVQLLQEQNAKLEKETAELRPLQSYKAAVIDCMETHDHTNIDYPDEERWGDEDSGFIKAFRDWYTDKVCMDKWEYDDVMESKEELNEYRIYKKVKAEMVSSGMDTSNVARTVRNIKKGVDKLNHA